MTQMTNLMTAREITAEILEIETYIANLPDDEGSADDCAMAQEALGEAQARLELCNDDLLIPKKEEKLTGIHPVSGAIIPHLSDITLPIACGARRVYRSLS